MPKNGSLSTVFCEKNVASNAVDCAEENGYGAVACGHTHFAEDLVVNGIRYLNTGAWTELPAHYLHITADDIILNRVDPSSLADRRKSVSSDQTATTLSIHSVPGGAHDAGRSTTENAP